MHNMQKAYKTFKIKYSLQYFNRWNQSLPSLYFFIYSHRNMDLHNDSQHTYGITYAFIPLKALRAFCS